IESALEEVERGELIKVVLARRQMLEFAADVNVPGVLHRLRSIFPSTAVFAVGGDSGDFVGASPERLVRAETGSFDIDVLAGTARRGRNPEEDAHLGAKLLTDVKNGREHTAVLDFVTQTVGPMAADLEIVPSTILR